MIEELYTYLEREFKDKKPTSDDSNYLFLGLEGRDVVTKEWNNNGPRGYQIIKKTFLGVIPEGFDIIKIPGTILHPWDSDFTVEYIGSRDIVEALKEQLDIYNSAALKILQLL